MKGYAGVVSGKSGEAGFRSEWAEVGGLRMHARMAGPAETLADAAPVILVHGLGVSSVYMVPMLRLLGDILPVAALDLPGFGRSEKPAKVRALDVPEHAAALAGWLEAQDLSEVSVISNSFGCQVVAELASRCPGLIGRCIFVGPTVDPSARSAVRQASRILLDLTMERPSMIAVGARGYLLDALHVLRCARYALRDRIEDKLPLIEVPSLVVRGEKDPLVPQQWAEEAARLLPDGRLVVVEGAPHAVNYSAAPGLVSAILPFLRGEKPDVLTGQQQKSAPGPYERAGKRLGERMRSQSNSPVDDE